MRYLIIRPGALGDLLVLRSALGLIRYHDPESHITLMGDGEKSLFLKQHGWVDFSIDYHHKACIYLFSDNPDAVPPQEFSFLQTIDMAVCYLKDEDGRVRRNLKKAGVKNILIHFSRPEPADTRHLYEFLSLPFRQSGFLGKSPPLYFFFTLKEISPVLQNLNIRLRNYFVIHPGSGSSSKNWSPEGFLEIARRLIKNIPVVFVGGEAEKILMSWFRKELKEDVKWLIEPDYSTLACLLAGAAGYLGNDSGVSHLVSCVGVKNRKGRIDHPFSVVLFGPSSSLQWAPAGSKILHPSSRIENITLESVWEAVKKGCR